MLRKLLKHECKDIANVIIPINLFTLGLALLFGFVEMLPFIRETDSIIITSIGSICIIVYILTLFVLVFGTFFYTVMHYYTSMYSDQGYLTHTLPISENLHLLSQTIIATFWCIVSTCVALLSILILCFFMFGVGTTFFELSNMLGEMFDALKQVFDQPVWFLIVYAAIFMLIGLIVSYLQFCFCLAVGQLSQKNRIACSAAAFVVVYVVKRVFYVVILWIFTLRTSFLITTADDETAIQEFFIPYMNVSFVCTVLICVFFYFGTLYINKKKLNLA